MLLYFYFRLAVFTMCEVYTVSVDSKVLEYFKSDAVHKLEHMWKKHRMSMENAFSTALQDLIGRGGIYLYVEKEKSKLSRGYYHDDKLVRIILSDLELKESPKLWQPYFSVSPASNIIKVEAHVSDMIVHAQYVLMRNKSDIIYDRQKQDPNKTSPFLFQQVHNMGHIAIIMEGCTVRGFIVVKLSGQSVKLGQNLLRLKNCYFTVEIYTLGLQSAPVIARYHPVSADGFSLQHLVMQEINMELTPKLQAVIFALINTTDIFRNELSNLIQSQEDVIQMTSEYMSEVVRKLNWLNIARNESNFNLKDISFTWDDAVQVDNETISTLTLSDMVVSGLDTVYSAHSGGPYKISQVFIGDEFRFSSVQVRGKVTLLARNSFEFAAGFHDIAVALELNLTTLQKQSKRDDPSEKIARLTLSSISDMEFSLPGIVLSPLEPLITGYLLHEVPKHLLAHLSDVIDEAALNAKNRKDYGETSANLFHLSYYKSVNGSPLRKGTTNRPF